MIKKYWAEILTFSAIATIMLVCLSPDITWMNTDSDGAHYILAAKYFTTAHNMSAPLYLLLGHLFLQIPFGTEAWRMGLMSAIPTIITSIYIYLIVKEKVTNDSKKRICSIVASLVYGGSALVISQSTIIETYSLATMAGVMAYYFSIKKCWTRASIMLGFGMPIHPFLTFIVWAVLFFSNKELRRWQRFMVTISFFLFYLYIPIVAKFGEPSMWGNTSPKSFFGGILSLIIMMFGGLSMYDIPKRILDTIGILVISFGVAVIPLAYYFVREHKLKSHLLWLFTIPIIYFATNLSAEVYVYMIVAIAYGSVLVGLGLSCMNKKWLYPMLIGVLALMGFNANCLDVGRTLDPEMSAMEFYNEELNKIPDGEIFMGGGWNWTMVYLYNREENRHIIPVSTDLLPSPEYRAILDNMGIKYIYPENESYISTQGKMALSIAKLNNNVWIAKETKPEVYQYIIEPAKGNESYIGRWIGQEIEPKWNWKPSNPYKYITGALEVSEWNHVLLSSINANVIISSAIIPLSLYWFVLRWWDKRRQNALVSEKA